jgi:hypothetical protein
MTPEEQHRHRCLVRQCLAWRVEHGRAWIHAWLAGYRGDQKALIADIVAQWQLGNRGKRNDWREQP